MPVDRIQSVNVMADIASWMWSLELLVAAKRWDLNHVVICGADVNLSLQKFLQDYKSCFKLLFSSLQYVFDPRCKWIRVHRRHKK